jgi:hypothetical protein
MANEVEETDISPNDLTAKMEAYCQFYADPDGPGYSRKEVSAQLAGYKGKGAPCQLMSNRKVRTRILELIKEHCQEHCLSPEKVLVDLEKTRLMALDKGDLNAAVRCSELQGKSFALFTDRSVFATDQDEERRRLTEFDRKEAEILADLRMKQLINTPAGPTVQADPGNPPTPVGYR